MFRAKTVFVIGAGASVEIALPVGNDLLKNIIQLIDVRFERSQQINGDRIFVEALKSYVDEGRETKLVNEHLDKARQLKASATQALSIDNVIDALEDKQIELVGKIAIVREILRSEATSSFFYRVENMPDTIQLSKFRNTWYNSLTQLLTEQVRKSNVSNIFENFQIINFNYDRCLEHYLPISLASHYQLKVDELREVMHTLKIYRPYGIAGRLPWQKSEGPSVDFGGGTPQQIATVAQQIRTFTERVEERSELLEMREAIASADRLVFLGFAFHRQNVELLSVKMQDHANIVATGYGISESDKSVISDELGKAFQHVPTSDNNRIQITDTTCDQLFRNYWRTLTADKGNDEAYQPTDDFGNWPRMPSFPTI